MEPSTNHSNKDYFWDVFWLLVVLQINGSGIINLDKKLRSDHKKMVEFIKKFK